MTDFIDKIITLVIIFVMVIIGPLTLFYVSREASAKRLIINEIEVFLDEVKDKGSIDSDNMDELYSKLNSHGMSLDTHITKTKRIVVRDGSSERLLESEVDCERCSVYDEMMWDENNDTDETIKKYNLKYGLIDGDRQSNIKRLKGIESRKYLYCLEKGDTLTLNVKEITLSSTKRVLYKVLGLTEGRLDISLSVRVK